MSQPRMTERQATSLLRAAGYTVAVSRGRVTVTDPADSPHVVDRLGLIAYARRVHDGLARPESTPTAREADEQHVSTPTAQGEAEPPATPLAADQPGTEPAGNPTRARRGRRGEAEPATAAAAQPSDGASAPETPGGLPGRGGEGGAPVVEPTYTLAEITGHLDANAAALKAAARRGPKAFAEPGFLFPAPAGVSRQLDAQVGLIVRGRHQPRKTFADAAMAELRESIAAVGIINRLIAFANEEGRLELIGGERRLRAATELGLPSVPVEVFAGTMRQIALASAVDNVQRADLTPLEEGESYERLVVEMKVSEAELARHLGRARTYIQQRRMLVRADAQLRDALLAEEISFTQARAVIQAAPGDPRAQRGALKAIRAWHAAEKRVTEDDARRLAENEVLKGARGRLEQLGWHVQSAVGAAGALVWADAERPARWSGPAILEALRESRRPAAGETPPVLELAREELEQIAARGHRLETRAYAPWVGVASGYAAPDRFLTWAEVRDELLPAARADIAALASQVEAHGWRLKVASGNVSLEGQKGGFHAAVSWENAQSAAKDIASGKLKDTKQRLSEPKRTCEDGIACGKKKFRQAELSLLDGKYRCGACADARRAIAKAQQDRVRQDVEAMGTGWLAACPDPLLRLLIVGCLSTSSRLGYFQHQPVAARLEIVAQRPREDLLAAATDLLAKIAWDNRETPLGISDLAAVNAAGRLAEPAPPQPAPSRPEPADAPGLRQRLFELHARLTESQDLTASDARQLAGQLEQLRADAHAARAGADAELLAELEALDRDVADTLAPLHQWLATYAEAQAAPGTEGPAPTDPAADA